MNRKIARNIALVSAVFIVTFSIMLITNYFQVRGVNPLQMEVIETLKEINDANSENTKLQEQIRQLDLLAGGSRHREGAGAQIHRALSRKPGNGLLGRVNEELSPGGHSVGPGAQSSVRQGGQRAIGNLNASGVVAFR